MTTTRDELAALIPPEWADYLPDAPLAEHQSAGNHDMRVSENVALIAKLIMQKMGLRLIGATWDGGNDSGDVEHVWVAFDDGRTTEVDDYVQTYDSVQLSTMKWRRIRRLLSSAEQGYVHIDSLLRFPIYETYGGFGGEFSTRGFVAVFLTSEEISPRGVGTLVVDIHSNYDDEETDEEDEDDEDPASEEA